MFYKNLGYWNFIFYTDSILCERRKLALSHYKRLWCLSQFTCSEFTKWLLVIIHFTSPAFQPCAMCKLLSLCVNMLPVALKVACPCRSGVVINRATLWSCALVGDFHTRLLWSPSQSSKQMREEERLRGAGGLGRGTGPHVGLLSWACCSWASSELALRLGLELPFSSPSYIFSWLLCGLLKCSYCILF